MNEHGCYIVKKKMNLLHGFRYKMHSQHLYQVIFLKLMYCKVI